MSEWRSVQLKDILEPTGTDAVPTPRDVDVRLAGVRLMGGGLYEASRKAGSSIKAKSLFQVVPGAFIYNRMWATRGTFAVVPSDAEGMFVTNEYPQFAVDSSELNAEYLFLLSQQRAFSDQVDAAAVGTTDRRRLHPSAFLELEVDLPPLAIQERVVATIAMVDAVTIARERELTATELVLRAAREELLETEGDWEDLPDDWVSKTLSEVADIRSGITKGRKTRGELRPVTFIRAANVQDGWLDLGELKTLDVSDDEVGRFRLECGDILMTEGGNAEHVGRGWLWEGAVPEAVAQNHVFRVRVTDRDVLNPRFLAYAIGAQPARDYCLGCAKKTTNLASINKTQVSEMLIPVPPLRVQEEIVRQLDTLRSAVEQIQRLIAAYEALRASLVEELVTGVIEPPALD